MSKENWKTQFPYVPTQYLSIHTSPVNTAVLNTVYLIFSINTEYWTLEERFENLTHALPPKAFFI